MNLKKPLKLAREGTVAVPQMLLFFHVGTTLEALLLTEPHRHHSSYQCDFLGRIMLIFFPILKMIVDKEHNSKINSR